MISFALFFSIENTLNMIIHKYQNLQCYIWIEISSLIVYTAAMIFVLNVFLKKMDKLKLLKSKTFNLLTIVICPMIPLAMGIYTGTYIWDKTFAFSRIRSWILLAIIIVVIAFAPNLKNFVQKHKKDN